MPSADAIPTELTGPTLDVIRLDERTLAAPSPPDLRPVTRLAPRLLTSRGPGPLLVAEQLEHGARVREVDLGLAPSAWWTDRLTPSPAG